MKHLLSLVILLSATAATADTLGANPQDQGRVTAIQKGVKEIDLGGMFVVSHSRAGDADASTRISTLGGLGFQYMMNDHVSAGGAVLASFDKAGDTTSTAFGGELFGTLHVRLGLGAFLRPMLGAGALFGSQTATLTGGQLMSSSLASGLVRIALPIAYFAGSRVVLQAGPELDVTVGLVTPQGGDSQSFTNVSGGFGVSGGYVF